MNDFKLNSNTKIKTGFKNPDNYFDTFSAKVLLKLPVEEPKTISFYERNKRYIFSAAAILIVALSIPLAYNLQSKEEELTSVEIENYITQHSSISDDDIVNLLNQEDIEKLKTNTPIEDETLEEILSNNDNIEQYITN